MKDEKSKYYILTQEGDPRLFSHGKSNTWKEMMKHIFLQLIDLAKKKDNHISDPRLFNQAHSLLKQRINRFYRSKENYAAQFQNAYHQPTQRRAIPVRAY